MSGPKCCGADMRLVESDCSCDGGSVDQPQGSNVGVEVGALVPVGHSVTLQPAGPPRGSRGIDAVNHSTMSSVSEDQVQTRDPAEFSVTCWEQTGSQGCPDIQGAGVSEFKGIIRAAIIEIVDAIANRLRSRMIRQGGESRYTRFETIRETIMRSSVSVTDVNGRPGRMTVNALLAAVAPCEQTKEVYDCKNPNYVTDARARVIASSADACAEAAKARAEAEAGANRLAKSRNCPSNPNSTKSMTQHCPTREVKPKVRWGLQLALKTKLPNAHNTIVRVGGIVTIPVDCLVPGAVVSPGTRQPEDPVPPGGGGGTPTPPGVGGGTVTPHGGSVTARGGGLASVVVESGHRAVRDR